METEIIKLDVNDTEKIEYIGQLIRNGAVVPIPTETVYGLAANALDEQAISEIFKVKGRPGDNPLIVHLLHPEDAEEYCEEIPKVFYILCEKFSPGPITYIMRKTQKIPNLVTAGLDTVAIRIPSHPIARAILSAAGVPIAAPSANLSGSPSTTRFSHVVEDLMGKVPVICDGGDSQFGLESTVIDITAEPPVILRPGSISPEAISEVIGQVQVRRAKNVAVPTAPGMKYRHYSPRTPLLETPENIREFSDFVIVAFEENAEKYTDFNTIFYGSMNDPKELSKNLFDALRKADKEDAAIIFIDVPKQTNGDYLALINRISKALGG